MKRLFATTSAATLAVLLMGNGAHSETYTGGLFGTYDGLGNMAAISFGPAFYTGLSWTVTNMSTSYPGSWVYNYTFAIDGHGLTGPIDYVINQLSQGVDYGNGLLTGTTVESDPLVGGIEVKTHTQAQGNLLLPTDIYGMKIETDFGTADGRMFSWQIVSDRAPMWGDFYGRSTDGIAYNFGWFPGWSCANPNDVGNGNSCLTAEGLAIYKVLVPDTEPTPVPVPAAMPLLLSGLAGLGWLASRRAAAAR